MLLSIIIPVFNEEKTIKTVLERVSDVKFSGVEKEIIVVNDGSKDTSGQEIERFIKNPKLKNIFYYEQENMGKGGALHTGILHAKGDYIVIQDADTEYDPQDIKKLLEQITNKTAKVVYGTRLDKLPNLRTEQGELKVLFFLHYLGNRMLSLITSILYGQWLTDMETCYKLFPRSAVEKMTLHAKGFAFEPEITAKLLKAGYKIKEVPITTTPRDYKEGKKLNALHDGPIALWTLVKYRFTS